MLVSEVKNVHQTKREYSLLNHFCLFLNVFLLDNDFKFNHYLILRLEVKDEHCRNTKIKTLSDRRIIAHLYIMFIKMLEIKADVVENVNAELFLKVFHDFNDVMFNLEKNAK